ncbi:FMN-dependent NADH-azoreductase [Streptomyces sp. NPDC086843]|uniref:FMN-dependent NADH-azoreductase n=1 Tax=Streptomyces sp. NPDC086843 TaxID=3365763 RepID=UPI00382EFF88
MATLLHIDSSVSVRDTSVSRAVTQTFRRTWAAHHPDGTVIYRDLAADPVAHITADAYAAGLADPRTRTAEQAAAFALRRRLIEELEQADAILIDAPMHTYTIPSTLKAWLDNVILPGRTAAEDSTLAGTPTTVVTSRDLSYAPYTAEEGHDFVQNYLTAVLAHTLRLDVGFIVAEFTRAPRDPALAALLPLFEWSRDRAHLEAAARARAAARYRAA